MITQCVKVLLEVQLPTENYRICTSVSGAGVAELLWDLWRGLCSISRDMNLGDLGLSMGLVLPLLLELGDGSVRMGGRCQGALLWLSLLSCCYWNKLWWPLSVCKTCKIFELQYCTPSATCGKLIFSGKMLQVVSHQLLTCHTELTLINNNKTNTRITSSPFHQSCALKTRLSKHSYTG